MFDKYLASFLIGFSWMFTLHYMLEPTFGDEEPRPYSIRMLFNYTVGVLGISVALLYLRPDVWFDLLISVAGAGIATVVAHGRDFVSKLWKRDKVHGLIEDGKK